MPEIDRVDETIRRVTDGRYVLSEMLGSGGMGSVYLVVTNDKFRLERALKIVDKNEGSYGEVMALKNLNHPGIPRIIEVLEDDYNIYIIQEYVKGKSLRQIIDENGKVPEDVALLWMNDIAITLAYLHSQGLIHRDIKPTNIMVTTNGEIKLIDFGLAKNIHEYDSIDENVIGTRNYTAPERYERRPADIRSDIYGFGTTSYFLTTGITPLEVTSASQKPVKVMIKNLSEVTSPRLKNIIARCIDLNPDKRFQSFNEIRYQLESINAYDEQQEKDEQRKHFEFYGLVALLVLGVLMTLTGLLYYRPERDRRFDELINEAQKEYNAGNLSAANELYGKADTLSADSLAAKQGQYEVATANGDYDGVIEGIKDLIANDPDAEDDPDITYLLGNAYYEKGEYTQAEKYLKQAIARQPTIENNLVLGLTYSALGQYDKAQQAISDLQNAGGDINTSTFLSGEIDQKRGDKNSAISKYEQVFAESSDSLLKERAAIALSELYHDENNFPAQVSILERAKGDPGLKNNYHISEYLGEAYYNLAESGSPDYYNKAADEFDALIKSGYDRPYIYRNLAIAYQGVGNYDQAESVLNQMEEMYPKDYTVNMQRAWLILEAESYLPESERSYNDFVEEYEKAIEKAEGASDPELDLLTERYQELVDNGWIY